MSQSGLVGAVEAATPSAFPARSKQAATTVSGINTEVNSIQFADKIIITISQNGKLGHWVHVPLTNPNPLVEEIDRPISVDVDNDGANLLPLPHLTASSILGASKDERETLGQLFATQIASAISSKHPREKRLLVVGLGFEQPANIDQSSFLQILDIVLKSVE